MESKAPIVEQMFEKHNKLIVGVFDGRRFIRHSLNGAAVCIADDEYWLFGIQLDRDDYWKIILNNNTEMEVAIAVYKYVTEDSDYRGSKKFAKKIELFIQTFYGQVIFENFQMIYL
jgi:hypothetical protein